MHERRTDDAEASIFAALFQRGQEYLDEVRPELEAMQARVRDLLHLLDLSVYGSDGGQGGSPR